MSKALNDIIIMIIGLLKETRATIWQTLTSALRQICNQIVKLPLTKSHTDLKIVFPSELA